MNNSGFTLRGGIPLKISRSEREGNACFLLLIIYWENEVPLFVSSLERLDFRFTKTHEINFFRTHKLMAYRLSFHGTQFSELWSFYLTEIQCSECAVHYACGVKSGAVIFYSVSSSYTYRS